MAHVVPAIYPAPELVSRISQENPPAGAVALWWLGQASIVLRAAGVTIYIDPYLAVSATRLSPPPSAPGSSCRSITECSGAIPCHPASSSRICTPIIPSRAPR
jgi:hypothetical protein